MVSIRYKQIFLIGILTLLVLAFYISPAEANNYGSQNLSWGSQGSYVTQLQQDLTKLGYNTYGIDGIFGENTYNAVIRFQKAQGIAVDGIVGIQTKGALNNTWISKTPVSRSGTTDVSKYPKVSKHNGIYGQFRYRDTTGGRIEVDPNWVAENIVTITLPGLNQRVRVHKHAADNFIQAFTYIKSGTAVVNGKRVSLLNLIRTMDGTYVPRHVNWDSSRGLSNHSWGTAIDINASDHFRYVNPSRERNDPNLILWEQAFKPAGFSWGNSYADSMHYELLP